MSSIDKLRSTPSVQDRYVAYRTQDNNGVYVAIDSITVRFHLPAEGERSGKVISLGSYDNQPDNESQLQAKLSYGSKGNLHFELLLNDQRKGSDIFCQVTFWSNSGPCGECFLWRKKSEVATNRVRRMMAKNVVHRSKFDGRTLSCSITFSPMDKSGTMSGPQDFLNPPATKQSDKGTGEQVWHYADADHDFRKPIVKIKGSKKK